METKDIPTSGPSDWRREPDERVNFVVGKLGEEAGELVTRCCRVMIQGLHAIDPDTGKPNLHHLADEIADVEALIALAKWFLPVDILSIHHRGARKYAYKLPWIEALPTGPHPDEVSK